MAFMSGFWSWSVWLFYLPIVASLFGYCRNYGLTRPSTLLGLGIPQKRRVFFLSIIKNDIWRVNQVRNSWRYQKKTGSSLRGSTMPVFGSRHKERYRLVENVDPRGDQKFVRDRHSCGSKHLPTSMGSLRNCAISNQGQWPFGCTSAPDERPSGVYVSNKGPNPLDYMGVYNTGENIRLAEIQNGSWVAYSDYTQSVNTS